MAVARVGSPVTFGEAPLEGVLTLPSITASTDDYIFVAIMYRNTGGMAVSAVDWDTLSLSLLQSVGVPDDDPQHTLVVYGAKVVTGGSHSPVATAAANANCASAAVVYGGQHATVPLGTIQHENHWYASGYTNPSRTITDAAVGDVMLEFLATGGWGNDFVDTSAATWAAANSQTEIVLIDSDAGPAPAAPKLIIAEKAGATGSQALGYTPSTGQPAYGHIAFAIKQAAAGASGLLRRRRS